MEIIKINYSDFLMRISLRSLDAIKEFAKTFNRAKVRNTAQYFKTNYTITVREELNTFSIWDPEKQSSWSCAIETVKYPVFFEGLTYDIDIEFQRDVSNARIYTKNEEIKQIFNLSRTIKGADRIAGELTFNQGTGNFELVIDYNRKTFPVTTTFSFQVFSSTVSLNKDIPQMFELIDNLYSRLILDFVKMTHHPFYSKAGDHKDLIWWLWFNNLYKVILKDLQALVSAPHITIETFEDAAPGDTIDRPAPWQSARLTGSPRLYFQVYPDMVTEDNLENRIIKYIVKDIIKTFESIYNRIRKSPSGRRMTAEYVAQLEFVRDALKSLIEETFFKAITDIQEISIVPHVLTSRDEYERVFSSWRKLKEAYKFFEGVYTLELKDNVHIYKLWCFARTVEVIESLGGELIEAIMTNKSYTNFALLPQGNFNGGLIFRMPNGDIAELHLDFINEYIKGIKNDKPMSPDIRLVVRKHDLPAGIYLTYLINACYESAELQEQLPDIVLPEDMAYMHRLTNILDKEERKKNNTSEGVMGSVILYPSPGTIEQFEKAIKDTIPGDIICIALNPGQPATANLLKKYLSDIFDTETTRLLKNNNSPAGIAMVKGEVLVAMPFIRKEDLTLIDYLKKNAEVILCHDKFLDALGEGRLRYIAPNIEGEGIGFIWEVKGFYWKRRKDVYPPDHVLANQDPTECLVLKLYRKEVFRKPLLLKGVVKNLRYTKMRYINKPVDGFVKTIAERETRMKSK